MEHLDYDILNTLKQVMEDDFELLIDTFVQDSTERIRMLRSLVDSTESDLIRRAAHSFKGSSSNIGAPQLAEMCSALEKKALANDFNGLADDINSIEQEFSHVQSLLRSLV